MSNDAGTLKDRFDRDGFVVVPDAMPIDACDALARRADQLVAETAPTGGLTVFTTDDQSRTSDEYFLSSGDQIRPFFEPEALDADGNLQIPLARAVNKLGHAMHDIDPIFDGFSRSEPLRTIAQSLGVEGHVLVQSMFIFKHPHIGGEVTCHTDDTFLWTEPRSCIGFWVAIDDATVDNGALRAIPGGHRLPVRKRFRRVGDGDGDGTTFDIFDAQPYPTDEAVSLPAAKGTVIALDGRLPHLSDANRTDRGRRAFTVHAIDPDAHYPADNWLRRDGRPLRGFWA